MAATNFILIASFIFTIAAYPYTRKTLPMFCQFSSVLITIFRTYIQQ